MSSNFFAIAFLVLFCVAWFVRFEWQMLSGEYWHNDDNAQHVAWMWKWKDGCQFAAGDLLNDAAEQLQPWGYVAVGRTAMMVLDPISFGKYMPLAALLATCFFAFFLVKKRFGLTLGLAAAALVGFLTFERMVGFNARAFGFPLLLAFLYFFADGKWRGVSICLIVSALFYPIVLLVELAMLGLEGVRSAFLNKTNLVATARTHFKNLTLLAVGALLAVAISFAKSRQIAAYSNIGPMFTANALLTLPMFSSEGRVDFTREMRPFAQVVKNGFQDPVYKLPIVVVAILLLLGASFGDRSHRRFDRALFYLPLAGIGLLVTARLLLPTLFLPTRYLTYTYPVFFSILLVRLLGIYAAFFQKWWATAILLAALILPRFWRFEPKNHAQQDYGNYSLLFKIVDELPPDHGLIAGPPDPCNMIPMRCKRSVLYSQEGFHALYFRNYWEKMAPRLFGYIDATTTADPAVVEAFVRKWGVSYLLVDRQLVEQGRKFALFEPFKSYLVERLAKNPERNFAINQFPDNQYFKIEKKYRLLDCRQWLGK